MRFKLISATHDDVIKWKHFRVTGPSCGEFTGPGEFPTQRPVTRSFDVLFDLRLNKRLRKQPWGWWFETPSWSLWRQRNAKEYPASKQLRAYRLAFPQNDDVMTCRCFTHYWTYEANQWSLFIYKRPVMLIENLDICLRFSLEFTDSEEVLRAWWCHLK